MSDPTPKSTKSRSRKVQPPAASTTPEWLADIQKLSFQDAHTALQLAMAQLQASDLDVEQMAGLYQRARAYADHCEAVLARVEQDVIEWGSEPPTENA
jgi:exodeoxyribonuclease VII small subunit